jgi:hypothetical protein
MKRSVGISSFVLLLAFWVAPWRLLVPAVHAQNVKFPVNMALAPPVPIPQGACVSQAPAGQHGITICWTASVSVTVTGYNVYTSTSAGGPYTKQNAAPVVGTSFFFSTANLGGVKEFIVVRSFDGVTESVNSTEVSGTAIGNPLPPTAVQVVSV